MNEGQLLLIGAVLAGAAWVSTALSPFSARDRFFLGWAGLRGAAPVVLATFALSAGLRRSDTVFNAVFFVVLVSTLLQGTTIEWFARRLHLVEPRPTPSAPPLQVDAPGPLEIAEFTVADDHAIAGSAVGELGLPPHALIAAVSRGPDTIPRGRHPPPAGRPALHPEPTHPAPGARGRPRPVAAHLTAAGRGDERSGAGGPECAVRRAPCAGSLRSARRCRRRTARTRPAGPGSRRSRRPPR